MNALAVIVNLFFPGIGLVLVGKRLAGIVFAVVFCLAVDGVLLSPILIGGKAAGAFVLAFAILAATVWLWSLVRLVLHVVFLRSPYLLEHKDTLFRTGMEYYLKNQLDEAKGAFTQLLALDGADADADIDTCAFVDGGEVWGLRTPRWKYMRWRDDPEMLYRIDRDPGENEEPHHEIATSRRLHAAFPPPTRSRGP